MLTLPTIIEALLDPKCYPHVPTRVDLRQTHISYLFFTPDHVYKVKKPVDFGFLDFTTLDKRRYFCHQEVVLNRRLSPEVYLDVVEIKQRGEEIKIGGHGKTVDYAVKMKRLPEGRMMDRLIDMGKIEEEMIKRTAQKIALFHIKTSTDPRISSFGSPDVIEKNTEENFSQTEDYIGRTITKKEYDGLREYFRGFLNKSRSLFMKRMEDGMIRDCHGDLHSEHICFTNDIVIFDCIEFNERFRYSDVIADIAFLAMDLDFHHRPDLSRTLCEEYHRESKDKDFSKLLNFYKVYRAYVRGKVEGFELDEPEIALEEKERAYQRAKRFFHLSHEYIRGGPRPFLIVVCGLLGTGKSTISKTLALRTGAEVISSDIIRKGIAGIPFTEHRFEEFRKGVYSKEFTDMTYREILLRAEKILKGGRTVVLDATFSRKEQREEALKLAKRLNSKPFFIECTCSEDTIRERLLKRAKEDGVPSDGRWEIYPKLKKGYERIEEVHSSSHIVIDTSQLLKETIQNILDKI